jgi:hypothetical protein
MSFQFINPKKQNDNQVADINAIKPKIPSEISFGKGLISNNDQNIWEWGDYKRILVTVTGSNLYFNNIKFGDDGSYTLNLDKNQKYLFDYTDVTNKSLTFRFKDTPDGRVPSGTILSTNDGINYYTNYATVNIDFTGMNTIHPFCTQATGYSGILDNSSHITFNGATRYISGNRNLKINDNLLIENVSGTINLTLPNNPRNNDKLNLILLSSGTVNLTSNNFLVNNTTGTVNILNNKEVYFHNNSWYVL